MKKMTLVLAALLSVSCGEFYYAMNVIKPNFDSATGGDRALLVRNDTSENLVAFHGTVDAKNLIGGVKATQTVHYFSKSRQKNANPDIFKTSHDFALVLVRNQDYKDNFFKLSDAPVFTTIYVAYNADSDPTYAYEISGKLGGDGVLLINNLTDMNAELRLNGINGVSIGYVPPQHKNTKIHLGQGDYELYVVFRRYSKKLEEMITYYPTDSAGDPRMVAFSLSGAKGEERVMDLRKEYVDITGITYKYKYAYLQVQNGFSNGIEVRNGSSILYQSTTGNKFINSGDYYSFQLEMPKAGNETAASLKLSSLAVWSGVKECRLPELTFEAGKIYAIRMITGADDTLTYETEGSESTSIKVTVTPINLDDIFAE